MADLKKLIDILNIKFAEPALLQTAFTHRSYLNESRGIKQSNERLEFLGDAVLEFIVSSYLYKVRQDDAEGALTNLRSYIVKTDSLAKAAQVLNLGKYLRMSKGEELTGGRENTQLLANTFEALLGAVFLDQGLEATEGVINKFLILSFMKEIQSGPPKDNKSALQELVQNKFKRSPRYRILRTLGPDHAKQFVIGVFVEGRELGVGQGSNKQTAEEEAAKEALDKLINKS